MIAELKNVGRKDEESQMAVSLLVQSINNSISQKQAKKIRNKLKA